MPRHEIRVGADSLDVRLDKYLARVLPDLSRSYLQRLIDLGRVSVDGVAAAGGSQKLRTGQVLVVDVPQPAPATLVPEDAPLAVIYEDGDLLVVDKPAGMVVHPAPGHDQGTLANIVIGRWEGPHGEETLRPGIVHRLDKDTSGLIVVAKNPAAQGNLSAQSKDRLMVKRYLTLLFGHLSPEHGTIEAPIGRDPRDRKRMAIVEDGRAARTHFHVLEYLGPYSLVEATLETGRTHQIRVHFRSIGFPVVGDPLYGVPGSTLSLKRQFLHAYRLGLRLPSTGDYVEFASPLPGDLQAAIDLLRRR